MVRKVIPPALAVLALWLPGTAVANTPGPPLGPDCTFARGISTCETVEQRQRVQQWAIVAGLGDSIVAQDCPTPTPPGSGYGPYAGYYHVTFYEERTVQTVYRGAKKVISRTVGPWTLTDLDFEFTGVCWQP